jgi:hypothetical protein
MAFMIAPGVRYNERRLPGQDSPALTGPVMAPWVYGIGVLGQAYEIYLIQVRRPVGICHLSVGSIGSIIKTGAMSNYF